MQSRTNGILLVGLIQLPDTGRELRVSESRRTLNTSFTRYGWIPARPGSRDIVIVLKPPLSTSSQFASTADCGRIGRHHVAVRMDNGAAAAEDLVTSYTRSSNPGARSHFERIVLKLEGRRSSGRAAGSASADRRMRRVRRNLPGMVLAAVAARSCDGRKVAGSMEGDSRCRNPRSGSRRWPALR